MPDSMTYDALFEPVANALILARSDIDAVDVNVCGNEKSFVPFTKSVMLPTP